MKKSKLMTPYLAGILLLGSLCMGTSVYADEGLQDSVPVLMEETELNQDDAPLEDSSISDTEDAPTEETDSPNEEPSTEEDTSDENQEEPEKPSDTVSVSANELYQGEQTVLEADGFYDEDAEGILHEIFVITVPSELTAGTLTKPVFENAEVTVLVDGEEIESEVEVINLAQKAKQIGIKVKSVGNILQQMEKLVLTLYNDTSAETESVIKTALHKFFEDGSVDVTDIQRLTVVLKGIKPVSEPDIGTPPEREPEYPEEQEPVEDPGDKPLDEDEKQDTEEEEEKPQKNPVEHIFEVIDNSGLNLMDSTVNVQDNKNLIFSSREESDDEVADMSFFEKEKIQSASVDEVGEEFTNKSSNTDSTDEGQENPSDGWKVIKVEKQNEKSSPVRMILLAVAAAALALIVPLAIRRRRNCKGEKNGKK